MEKDSLGSKSAKEENSGSRDAISKPQDKISCTKYITANGEPGNADISSEGSRTDRHLDAKIQNVGKPELGNLDWGTRSGEPGLDRGTQTRGTRTADGEPGLGEPGLGEPGLEEPSLWGTWTGGTRTLP